MTLPDSVDAIPVARRAVEVVAFSVEPETREHAQLVVSELVTNGLQHGRGAVTLSFLVSELGRVSGAVIDEGDGFDPPPPPAPGDGPGGWGLSIVASLVETWGVQGDSTRVWFAMPAGRD